MIMAHTSLLDMDSVLMSVLFINVRMKTGTIANEKLTVLFINVRMKTGTIANEKLTLASLSSTLHLITCLL